MAIKITTYNDLLRCVPVLSQNIKKICIRIATWWTNTMANRIEFLEQDSVTLIIRNSVSPIDLTLERATTDQFKELWTRKQTPPPRVSRCVSRLISPLSFRTVYDMTKTRPFSNSILLFLSDSESQKYPRHEINCN